ncbi:hypothetical protein HELRODRAFT_74560 [Helobdella robusta]|uniref:Cytochrome b5 heme-binding domain-containing protein n=1 Tax=Helobdella robusta TaxID=6412 RepID=T1G1S7_HELRO|nr:hypothetical protein HELRODRAFT_74560 [Helobdella robusta]ESO08849.1 hypothetical protein HELRODRAFT_74560 [Helobdella robusta]
MTKNYFHDVFSPFNAILLGLCAYLLYKIIKRSMQDEEYVPSAPQQMLTPMKKRDFTLDELRKFDGKQEDGRILMAVNGTVFDVTRGKRFYGEGGAYSVFAGRDASRGLGTMCLEENALKNEYDDLSDLSAGELDIIRDWESSFSEKLYDIVGKLIKDGDEHGTYDDEDEIVGDVVPDSNKKTD